MKDVAVDGASRFQGDTGAADRAIDTSINDNVIGLDVTLDVTILADDQMRAFDIAEHLAIQLRLTFTNDLTGYCEISADRRNPNDGSIIGNGNINYRICSFPVCGIGRYKPAHKAIRFFCHVGTISPVKDHPAIFKKFNVPPRLSLLRAQMMQFDMSISNIETVAGTAAMEIADIFLGLLRALT